MATAAENLRRQGAATKEDAGASTRHTALRQQAPDPPEISGAGLGHEAAGVCKMDVWLIGDAGEIHP